MRHSTRLDLTLITLIALVGLVVGCGDQVEAPVEALPSLDCPTLDEALSGTLAAIHRGEAAGAAEVLNEASALRGTPDDPIATLLRTLLGLFQTLEFDAVEFDAGDDDTLTQGGALLAGQSLGEALAGALGALIAPPADSPEANDRLLALDVMVNAAQRCPEGSMTGLVRALAADRAVLDELAVVIADPRFGRFFAPLLTPEAGDAGLSTVVTLWVTAVGLFVAEPFDFEGFAGLMNLIMPNDEPPMSDFLVTFERFLQEGGLGQLQTVLSCVGKIQVQDSADRTVDGIELLGELIYFVLAGLGLDLDAGLDAAAVQGALTPLIDGVDQLSATIQSQDALRDDLLKLMAFFLAPRRARPLLEAAVALLEAGALEELLTLAQGLSGDACVVEAMGGPP